MNSFGTWKGCTIYDNREGFSRNDDSLPPRLLTEAPTEGPPQGWISQLEPILKEYSRSRGWDDNGVPTPKKQADLGLENL